MKYTNDHIAALGDNFVTVGNTRTSNKVVMSAKNCNVFYGNDQALKNINIEVGRSEVLALIGPSGCGKSTFLRCLNRLNDTIDSCRVSGQISLEGEDIYSGGMDVVLLRARVGMVFQKPNPFPKSIYENVAYGPKIHGITSSKKELDELVDSNCRSSGLEAFARSSKSSNGSWTPSPKNLFHKRFAIAMANRGFFLWVSHSAKFCLKFVGSFSSTSTVSSSSSQTKGEAPRPRVAHGGPREVQGLEAQRVRNRVRQRLRQRARAGVPDAVLREVQHGNLAPGQRPRERRGAVRPDAVPAELQ